MIAPPPIKNENPKQDNAFWDILPIIFFALSVMAFMVAWYSAKLGL